MQTTSTTYSRAEALRILEQCRLLRESIDRLTIIAMKSLRPNLKLVEPASTGK